MWSMNDPANPARLGGYKFNDVVFDSWEDVCNAMRARKEASVLVIDQSIDRVDEPTQTPIEVRNTVDVYARNGFELNNQNFLNVSINVLEQNGRNPLFRLVPYQRP